MNFKRWKLGVAVSLLLSLFVAGASLASSHNIWVFLSVFCAACITHFGAFVTQNPVDKITFDSATISRTTETTTVHTQTPAPPANPNQS